MKNLNNPFILHFDTATEVCSVALSKGTDILALEESRDGNSHAKCLIPFIESVLSKAAIDKKHLDAIALGNGPGSYTGLRIGAATAKGLCYSLEIPLIAIPTPEIIMYGAKKEFSARKKEEFSGRRIFYCPMIDARRMEVFTALYDSNGNITGDIHALILDENSFDNILKENIVLFCGNGMPKCREMLSRNPNACFSDAPLSAANMIEKALFHFYNKKFEDTAYFEPFYLKEYIAAKSVVKGLQ